MLGLCYQARFCFNIRLARPIFQTTMAGHENRNLKCNEQFQRFHDAGQTIAQLQCTVFGLPVARSLSTSFALELVRRKGLLGRNTMPLRKARPLPLQSSVALTCCCPDPAAPLRLCRALLDGF